MKTFGYLILFISLVGIIATFPFLLWGVLLLVGLFVLKAAKG